MAFFMRYDLEPMAPPVARVTLHPTKIEHLLRGRTGEVGRMMAGFAGLSTKACKQVASERVADRTKKYVNSISSTTVGTPVGVAVVTSATAPQSLILEKGSPPHVIVPRTARVLRFEAPSGEVVFRPRVQHPGTQPYHILRDGVRRAGQQLSAIAFGR